MSGGRPARGRRPVAAKGRPKSRTGKGRRTQSRPARSRRVETRRLRLPVVALFVFAVIVLVTSMPVSALLTQHHQLATTSAALERAQAADRSLTDQAKALANTGTVNGLARTDYGLVPSGQKAYVILPPSGASSSEVAGSGHVPLESAPVVPGSTRARALAGLGTASSGDGAAAGGGSGRSGHNSSPVGFWTRVAHTLEFWR